MCGICGLIGRVDESQHSRVFRFLTALSIATESRGIHATGYAGLDNEGKVFVEKSPVRASEFIHTESWLRFRDQMFPDFFMVHCRSATHGDPKVNLNNHPFMSRDGKYAFAHNGIINDFKFLASRENVELSTECDSEVILRIIEKFKDPIEGIKKIYENVFQYMRRDGACILLDADKRRALMFRNPLRTLHVIRLKEFENTVAFASTRQLLCRAVEDVFGKNSMPEGFDIKSERIYMINLMENGTPKIETEDVEIKRDEVFSRQLPPPMRRQYTVSCSAKTQGELFDKPIGFDEIPEEGPQLVECHCGYEEFLWSGETKKCSACASYDLSTEGVSPVSSGAFQDTWLRIHCENCGFIWERRPGVGKLRCIKCGSTWTAVIGTKSRTMTTPTVSIWKCLKCNVRFVAAQQPGMCTNCRSNDISWEGKLEGAVLPESWNFKKCHDCGDQIPSIGPSRCIKCIEKRRLRKG